MHTLWQHHYGVLVHDFFETQYTVGFSMYQNIPLVHLQNFKILDCKRPTFVIYNSLTNGRFSFNVKF